MVFPTVAPLDPKGSWFVQTWISTILEGFCVNLSFSAFVVLEKNIFKWPHPIFAFLWLSLIWIRPQALDLYNFRFPLPKDDLYQVWLKLNYWCWRIRFFKILSIFLLFFFAIICPWGRGLSFICTILNPLCLRIICANFG
jgi:hypothetical protein